MYRWFIAYKHVFSRLVTFAGLMAVTLSVAVLIVVVSVMEGFRSEVQKRIRGTTSDIKVSSTRYVGLDHPRQVADLIAEIDGVQTVSPVIETLVLYRAEHWLRSAEAEDRPLQAFDLADEESVRELNEYVGAIATPDLGRELGPAYQHLADNVLRAQPRDIRELFSREWIERGLWLSRGVDPRLRSDENGDASKLPAVLAGVEAIRREFLLPGQVIKLTSISPVTELPRTQRFVVAGYFKTGIYELDSKGLITTLDAADQFLVLRHDNEPRRVSALRVVASPERRGEEELVKLRVAIEKTLDDHRVLFVNAQTWREARSSLLNAIKIEKFLLTIILGVVVLFSGFMVFIILTVQVVDKMRDIGVLQSLGATSRGISSIFFIIGSGLCLAGTALGLVYGVSFALSVNTIQRWIKLLTGYEVFPEDVYYLDHIPVVFRVEDLTYIIIPTLAASLLASVIPAIRASRRDAAEVLRYG